MTRKRRYLISVGILVGCVCAVVAVFVMLPPQPGVTKANFDRIREGAIRIEVNALFGKPSGVILIDDSHGLAFTIEQWRGDDGACATVDIQNSTVIRMEWTPSAETFPDKLRRWLHLPK